jgi:hypothetical protein
MSLGIPGLFTRKSASKTVLLWPPTSCLKSPIFLIISGELSLSLIKILAPTCAPKTPAAIPLFPAPRILILVSAQLF